MSTSTYSSSATWSWTSEVYFDHDLTIVVLHKEISVRLQVYLSKKELEEGGNDLSPGPGLLDNLRICHSQRVSTVQD